MEQERWTYKENDQPYSKLIIRPSVIDKNSCPPGPWPGKYDTYDSKWFLKISIINIVKMRFKYYLKKLINALS